MKKILSLFLLILLLAGCSVSVKTVYDHQIDFTKYKTFCWMNGCDFKYSGPQYLKDSLKSERLKKFIVAELNRKGLVLNSERPDLLVAFNVTVKDGETVLYHQSDDRSDFGPIADHIHAIPYLKGTLVLAMADKSLSKMVWESVAVSYTDLNPDLSGKNIESGIKAILKKFPPKKNK